MMCDKHIIKNDTRIDPDVMYDPKGIDGTEYFDTTKNGRKIKGKRLDILTKKQ